MTDMGSEMSNLGIQVCGGYGYIREWGMEQLVRDARIAQLCEGTNGIQALDLISRKLARDKGTMLEDTFELFNNKIEQMTHSDMQAQVSALLAEWLATATKLKQQNAVNLEGAAYDFMNYSAYCLLGVIWLSIADTAEHSDIESIKLGKKNTCDFYLKRLLPRKDALKANLFSGADDLMVMTDNEFDYQ